MCVLSLLMVTLKVRALGLSDDIELIKCLDTTYSSIDADKG